MFASNLKRIRKKKKYSQEDIAWKLHITRQTVSSWETGRCEPDIEMLKALADVLGVEVQELICGIKTKGNRPYDRKYLIPTSILGGIVAVCLLFRILLYSNLRAYCYETYNGRLLDILLFVFPQISFLTGGMFLGSLHNLFSCFSFHKLWKYILRCIGIVTVSLTIIIMIGYLPIVIPVISRFSWSLLLFCGRTFVIYVFPFLAGGILTLSLKG